MNFSATINLTESVKISDYVIVSTPTNYNDTSNFFDTSSVEMVIEKVNRINPKSLIVIKSTIPVGFVNKMRENLKVKILSFLLNFLEKDKHLEITYILIDYCWGQSKAKKFASLLLEGL